MESRLEISLDEYQKAIRIEALTMSEMIRRQILPSSLRFSSALASSVKAKEDIGVKCSADSNLCQSVSSLSDDLLRKCDELDECIISTPDDIKEAAFHAADKIIAKMNEARRICDSLETMCDKSYWPLPTYSEILSYV